MIGAEKTARLIEAWHEDLAEGDAVAWLTEHGFDPSLATRIVRVWGGEATAKLRGNPYVMLTFSSWERVDASARRLGLSADDPRRLIGAVEAVLYRRLDDKHTLCPDTLLATEVGRLLRCRGGTAERAVRLAVEDGAAVRIDGGCQPAGAHVMERFVDETIRTMRDRAGQGNLFAGPLDGSAVAVEVAAFERTEGYALTSEQRAAVAMALNAPVSVLIGGAGVGKTTALKAVHWVAEGHGVAVQQMALSGKASQRMREATGRDARTIAGFLKARAEGRIVCEPSSLIIVDEASMLDLPTTYSILRVMPEDARLLLVGDPYQLPPIGFGLFCHGAAQSSLLPRIELTRVHRQAESTGIPMIAKAIRDGNMPVLPAFRGPRPGVSFLPCAERDLVGALDGIVAELGGFEGIQVLSPLRGRPSGTEAINAHFHRILGQGRRLLPHHGIAEGEPVLWTANDWSRGLFNGALGSVKAVPDEWSAIVAFEASEVRLEGPDDLRTLSLAYAITVHKAQGSAFRRVVVPIFPSRLLDRTLVYTAVTRATDQVVLVGNWPALRDAVVAEPNSGRRMVGLHALLGAYGG